MKGRIDAMRGIHVFLGAFVTGVLSSGTAIPALAQVTSDGTTNTTVNTIGNNSTILNGIERGNNLFHSFSNFSVPNGGSASFDLTNTPNITTIFSRVTGGNISDINGLIQTLNGNNPASLFLINPAGIIFGQNASLNIGGSFVGTTAQSVVFGDGTEFSAVQPTANPLLTMSVPVGLQMGSNPGDITINNSGHSLSASSPIQRIIPSGLEVKSDNTLALIGRNIFSEGGFLGANGGNVELGAVGSNNIGSTVKLNFISNGWRFDYGENSNLGEIKLTQKSFIDSSSSDNSSIKLVGKNISIEGSSIILIQTENSTGKNVYSHFIKIKASETFSITGNTGDSELLTNITSETLGSGSGADILIEAKHLFVTGGAQIETKSFGTGNAAKISVNTSESINIEGASILDPDNNSTIGSLGFGSGDAGEINLSTANLTLTNGGNITSTSLMGSGNGGNVLINAKNSVNLIGTESNTSIPTILSSNTITQGNGGNLTINTKKLLLSEGGRIDASTFSSGNAGNVVINASESVEVNGKVEDSINASLIIASANILDENIRAIFGLPDQPSGESGSITINTPELRIINGGSVTVQNDGVGKGGTLNINSDRVFLNQASSISASTASGNGGNVSLNLQENMVMRYGSRLLVSSRGTGNGGNITINSPVIVGLENSDIIANAVQGNGGNINITTQGIFGLEFRDLLTSESDITASSEFGVNGTVDINNFGVDPSSGLAELSIKLADASEKIATACADTSGSSFIATGRGGIPQNPNQQVNTNRTWSDIRNLSAYRQNQSVAAQGPKTPETLVQATSWRRNADGKIELVADKSSTQMQPSLTCAGIAHSYSATSK